MKEEKIDLMKKYNLPFDSDSGKFTERDVLIIIGLIFGWLLLGIWFILLLNGYYIGM